MMSPFIRVVYMDEGPALIRFVCLRGQEMSSRHIVLATAPHMSPVSLGAVTEVYWVKVDQAG